MNIVCNYCNSGNVVKLNTYKHYAIVCNDCCNVSHLKKSKYFLEYIFPRKLALLIMPRKAFLRLFSNGNNFNPPDFYDSKAFNSTTQTAWRSSEEFQVIDQLLLAGFNPKGKLILDISGGPGSVGQMLAAKGADVIVTEYSESAVKAMNEHLNIRSIKFDYTADSIREVVSGEFDLILIRSSIIFCPKLDKFMNEVALMVKPGGAIFIESILPTLGEIYWWQQLEYKFPFIYSQETIEKSISKNGFYLKYGYRDYGGYAGVKFRSYTEFDKQIFTWLIDFPMMLAYYLLAVLKKPCIDRSLGHKMITQFWQRGNCESAIYKNFKQGGVNMSKTFGYKYNGYLNKSD